MRTATSSWTLPLAASVVCLGLGFSACSGAVEVAPTASNDAGTTTTDDAGTVGPPPHLQVTPDTKLDFTAQTATVSTLPLEICNVPDPGTPTVPSGDLVIHAVTLDQPSNYFALLNPPDSDALVPSGDCITLDVQFTRVGGLQTRLLTIETNDPLWGPPAYKQITLISNPTSTRPLPVASCGFDPATVASKRIRICDDGSYDPPLLPSDPAPRGIGWWEFIISKAPAGAQNVTITQLPTNGEGPNVSRRQLTDSDCDGIAGDGCCVDLNVDPMTLGEYRVACIVYDLIGERSGNIAEVRIIVR